MNKLMNLLGYVKGKSFKEMLKNEEFYNTTAENIAENFKTEYNGLKKKYKSKKDIEIVSINAAKGFLNSIK